MKQNFLQEQKKYITQKKKVLSFDLLTNPTEIIADENGMGKGYEMCSSMELGEPDASGRRRPVEIHGF